MLRIPCVVLAWSMLYFGFKTSPIRTPNARRDVFLFLLLPSPLGKVSTFFVTLTTRTFVAYYLPLLIGPNSPSLSLGVCFIVRGIASHKSKLMNNTKFHQLFRVWIDHAKYLKSDGKKQNKRHILSHTFPWTSMKESCPNVGTLYLNIVLWLLMVFCITYELRGISWRYNFLRKISILTNMVA